MRLQSGYRLEIVTIDLDDAVQWLAVWHDDHGTIWTAPSARLAILDAYSDACRWAMMHGPDELCETIIQLKR